MHKRAPSASHLETSVLELAVKTGYATRFRWTQQVFFHELLVPPRTHRHRFEAGKKGALRLTRYRMPSFSHKHCERPVIGICSKKLMLKCLVQSFPPRIIRDTEGVVLDVHGQLDSF